MNSNEDTAHQRLDPTHINLHQHLHHHLANVAPLLADHLNISVGQAKVALSSAIDVSLLAQMANLGSSTNATAENDSLAAPSRKRSQLLYHSLLDTTTFARLPTLSLREFFAEKEALILAAFAKDTQLARDKSDRLMALVATMSAQRIDSLSAYHGLNHSEKAYWLALQPLFFMPTARHEDDSDSAAQNQETDKPTDDRSDNSNDSDGIQRWAARLGLTLKAPKLSYRDYHQQLGRKDCQLFDQSRYPIPNHAWLIRLANHISQAHSTPLTIGSTLKPNVKIPSSPNNSTPSSNTLKSNTLNSSTPSDSQNKAPRTKKAAIIAAVLSLSVVALSAFFYFNTHDKESSKPVASEKPVSIPQDVAIIRVDDASDDDTQSDDNTNNKDNKDSKAQGGEHKAAEKAKEKSQLTDSMPASPSKDAEHLTQNK